MDIERLNDFREKKKEISLMKETSVPEKLKLELEKEISEVEGFIYNTKDSSVRQVLILRYIKGATWDQVGREIGYVGGDGARKRVKRYLQKLKTGSC